MKAQICLTYDDALPVHRESIAPVLAQQGIRATFYIPAARDDLHEAIAEWRRIATLGHELGNHTCWHPCRTRASWTWKPAYRLEEYDKDRIRDELLLANRILYLIDGRTLRSYGATCGDLACGPGRGASFIGRVRDLFSGIRSGCCERPSMGPLPFVFPSCPVDYRKAEDVIDAIRTLRDLPEAWMVLSLHGVGTGTHQNFMESDEHGRLVDWISKQASWLDAVTVTEAVLSHRRQRPEAPPLVGDRRRLG